MSLFRRAYPDDGGVIPTGIRATEGRYYGRAVARSITNARQSVTIVDARLSYARCG
jgi:hypothetical protein